LSQLELRVPPPIVALLAGLLMWFAAKALPALGFHVPARAALAGAIGFLGLLLGAIAFFQFRRVGTTPNPLKPYGITTLVVNGVYRRSRNPMYLGDALILIAWALWLANAAAFLGLPLFVVYLNRFQIAAEERALQSRFGAAYVDYCQRVRRWV
jgi:protein-S-isoprenylcysteine O-methyltransferase Ste14